MFFIVLIGILGMQWKQKIVPPANAAIADQQVVTIIREYVLASQTWKDCCAIDASPIIGVSINVTDANRAIALMRR